MMTKRRIEPLENPVPEELFVNRHYELELFWDWAMSIPKRPANSFALIGRRRTGKTAILKKIYNQLFEKQERILPVYITFDRYLDRDTPIDSYEFAAEYFGSYIGCYLAFHHRQPALLDLIPNLHDLYQAATRLQDEFALSLFDQYEGTLNGRFSSAYILMQSTLNIPRREARWRDMPTAVIIDEFQVLTRVYNPESQRHNDLTDSFQKAAETLWAPLLVSGSAVSLLVEQALGGMLNGRFGYYYVRPLSRSYTHDLVFRWGAEMDVEVTEELAEAIWQLTAGYPYAIQNLMKSASPARQRFPSLAALEEVLNFELSDAEGKLWQHYDLEFRKYSNKLNSGQVTKKVMYWATKYPEQQIDAERVAQEIGVDFEQVQDSLRKLYETDIIDRIGWTLYQGPKDPILRRYIEYNHKREIEKLGPAEIFKDWQKEYKRLRGQANNEKGQFAEVHVGAVMRSFDGREVDGSIYFNQAGPIRLPNFDKIERRTGIVVDGIAIEIDLVGEWEIPATDEEEAKRGAWLVQVKYAKKRIREKAVSHFLTQVAAMKKQGYESITCWFFAKGGFVKKGIELLDEAGVLYSNRAQFNKLANLFDLFGLPE